MNNYSWFKFDPSQWMMGRIQRTSDEAQAAYMRLCCIYWTKECLMSKLDAEAYLGDSIYAELLEKRVIVIDDAQNIVIPFLIEQRVDIENQYKGSKEAGRLGNLKRWHPELYQKVLLGKLSPPDAWAITTQSGTQSGRIADKNKEESRTEESNISSTDKKKLNKEKLKSRKAIFAATLEPFVDVYGKDLLNEFYQYWTEENKSGTKFKQEMERTWSVARRLKNWDDNNTKFGKSKFGPEPVKKRKSGALEQLKDEAAERNEKTEDK